jgi:hypothetical protein
MDIFFNGFIAKPPTIEGYLHDLSSTCQKHLTNAPAQISITIVHTCPPVYRIDSIGNKDASWQLAVTDPAAALQCLRAGCGPSLYDIARYLLEHGIGFTTWYKFSGYKQSLVEDPPYRCLLGWRLKIPGQHLNYTDYLAYEHTRTQFFDKRRARAALKHGGILWRLAIDSLGISGAASLVFEGPDSQPRYRSQCTIPEGSRDIFYDEMLTQSEIDLICGVYMQYDGAQFGNPTHISWWPRPYIFSNSGLNFGCWTPFNERWFQGRLNAIREGMQKPLSSSEWRRNSIYQKKTRIIHANNVQLAHEYITTHP